jgi:hypothetical protein
VTVDRGLKASSGTLLARTRGRGLIRQRTEEARKAVPRSRNRRSLRLIVVIAAGIASGIAMGLLLVHLLID